MAVIEVEGLSKIYRKWIPPRTIRALESLTLSVGENHIFGFLGPNGAGKTTTIKLLLGLNQPTGGTGFILGKPLGDQETKARVGFLPDSPQFYAHLTAKNFLYYCAKLLHLPHEVYSVRVAELLKRMNLMDAENRKMGEFSRGMLQRVGIAQAMLNNPDLVILDEPLTGLDPLGRVEIKNIMEELKRDGKTVFFSSHVLADVEQMCDDIGILNRGRLVRTGMVNELLVEQSLTVWVKNLPTSEYEAMQDLTDSMTMRKDQCGFALKEMSKADEFRALVAQKGGEVVQVEGKRESLEEYFLALVEQDNTKRKEEVSV
ncbi:MAG: hypothetical protein A3K19_07245 [Lentisphaerae bacterium RIFOXYB12_FULL_65_16]|nr:MAG: hypothetical protein A3K18_07115 [Lentisphaerae bacterium RIFOXYA12_64_32]OGV93317.1 MAG: hypothetical protein A3K19_07245 [Lentisphaerae bacterium RIFOXYB12_FULL_65_16]